MSVFLEAVKVIEQRGWTQDEEEIVAQDSLEAVTGTGRVCVNLALYAAAGGDYDLASWAQAFLADRVLRGRKGWAFNDDPSTTVEDVVLSLKRAHELSEAGA